MNQPSSEPRPRAVSSCDPYTPEAAAPCSVLGGVSNDTYTMVDNTNNRIYRLDATLT